MPDAVSVQPIHRYVWAPALLGSCGLGAGLGVSFVGGLIWLPSHSLTGESTAAGGLIAGTIFFVAGLLQSVYWFARAGTTSYEVGDGELRVIRKGRKVASWPCATLGQVDVGDSWRLWQVLPFGSGAIGGLPELRVEGARIGSRIDYRTRLGWPILLKTETEVQHATQILQQAIAEQRS